MACPTMEPSRVVPVSWAVGGSLPGAVIVGRDGFYVRLQRSYDAPQLSVGHVDVVGGLWQEWTDGCRYPGDGFDPESTRLVRGHARRMIRAARRQHAVTA